VRQRFATADRFVAGPSWNRKQFFSENLGLPADDQDGLQNQRIKNKLTNEKNPFCSFSFCPPTKVNSKIFFSVTLDFFKGYGFLQMPIDLAQGLGQRSCRIKATAQQKTTCHFFH